MPRNKDTNDFIDAARKPGKDDRPTPGPWEVLKSRDVHSAVVSPGVATVCMDIENFADATLIAEAGSVFHEVGKTPRQLLQERHDARELVVRAVRGLKHIGSFRRECGEDPHPLDCTLAGRVSRVFCTGMTRAIELCRLAGQDPEWMEDRDDDQKRKQQES